MQMNVLVLKTVTKILELRDNSNKLLYMFRPVAKPLPGYAHRMACCITGWPVV